MDDIFIRVIRYAVNKDGPFDLLTMFSDLDVTDEQKKMLMDQIAYRHLLSHSKDYIATNIYAIVKNGDKKILVWCSAIDRFRLLEYQELKEARQSSLDANKMATRAIWISILSFLSAIMFSIYQITNPISLPEKHYTELSRIVEVVEKAVELGTKNNVLKDILEEK